MKFGLLTTVLLSISFAPFAYAQSAKTLCPKVLNAAGVSTGLSQESLRDLYDSMDSAGTFNILPVNEIERISITPGQKSSAFKINIEEVKLSGGSETKKLSIECPIVRDWKIATLPIIQLTTPAVVKDEIEPEVFGKTAFAIRNGVRLIKLFHDSSDFVSVSLFWNVDSEIGEVPSPLPKVLANSENSIESLKILDPRFPIRGLRISTTRSFGNVWYLLTKNTIANLGKLEFLTNSEESISAHSSYAEFAKGSVTLESLDFYDSINSKFIPCTQILAKDYNANCYNFNTQLNPNLWKILRAGEAFFVQFLVPLEK
ncbi:MAG: hypothetical protein EOP04_06575, partial [Proteobacteria bacterium]